MDATWVCSPTLAGSTGSVWLTAELTPRPLSLRVLPGDLLELTEELPSGREGSRAVLYHWNGFGFTAMDPAGSP